MGNVIGVDELKEENVISSEEINKLRQEGIVQFVKNEKGITPLREGDAVFVESQRLLSRLNMMLAKLDSLGYETSIVLRKSFVR